MIPIRSAVAVSVVMLLTLHAVAEAGPAEPLAWGFRVNQQYDNPIEQQTPGWLLPCPEGQPDCAQDQSLWVLNPTIPNAYPCSWDPDDHWRQDTIPGGYLDPGQSITLDACYILDWIWSPNRQPNPGYFGALTVASKPGLIVTVCTDADTRSGLPCSTGTPVKVGNQWRAETCIAFSAADNVEDFPPIPDSNGGRGEFANVTVTVTNVSGQRLRDVTASVQAVNTVTAQPRRLAGECP